MPWLGKYISSYKEVYTRRFIMHMVKKCSEGEGRRGQDIAVIYYSLSLSMFVLLRLAYSTIAGIVYYASL